MNSIPLSNTNLAGNLVKDYLQNTPTLSNLYNYYNNKNSFEQQIKDKSFSNLSRQILHEAISKQYQQAGIELTGANAVLKNINLLKNENTFTVTTGHQLVLAGGPLYVTYKILTTIKLADWLKENFENYHFVPIFWMASEDHDFEEISEINLFNNKYKWNINSNNKPVGKLTVAELEFIVNKIAQAIGLNNTANKYAQLLKECYTNGGNLSTATLKWFHDLFNEYGLIILEPDNAQLKKCMIPVFENDILHNSNYYAHNETNHIIEQLNYKTQINARQINTFYLDDNLGRILIKKEEDLFNIGNTTCTTAQIKELIANQPEKFSPNVALRPIYQELVLPNLAYIGGPAEVAYWLQLKKVFEVNNIKMPLVLLRYMAIMAGSGIIQKAEKLHLQLADLLLAEEQLKLKILEVNNTNEHHNLIEDILKHLQILIDYSKDLDASVTTELIETKLNLKKFLDLKKKQLNTAALQKQNLQIEKALKIKQQLFPSEIFQERIVPLMQFECQLDKSLLKEIYLNINLNALHNLTIHKI